jgi:hypothetical protein
MGLGPIAFSGLRAAANGSNLSIDITAGTMHQEGINWHTDPQSPSVKTFSANTLATFNHSLTSTIGISATVLDVDNFDNGFAITEITGSGARSTNMRVYLFNSGFVTVQYGQQIYSNLAAAEAAIISEPFVVEPFTLSNALLIAVISVRSDATDLTDLAQAQFFSASKFGEVNVGVGGTATTNLQQAYDNSTQPQILLTTALGGMQIRDQATPIAAPLFEVLDSAGAAILDVSDELVIITAACEIIGNTVSAPGIVFRGIASSQGEMAVPTGEKWDIGHWNGSTFTTRMNMNSSGNFTFNNNLTVQDDLTVEDNCTIEDNLTVEGTTSANTLNSRANSSSLAVGGNITTANVNIGSGLSGRASSTSGSGIITLCDNSATSPHLEVFHHNTGDGINIRCVKTGGDADLILRGTAASEFYFGSDVTTGKVHIGHHLTTGDITIGAAQTTGEVIIGSAASTVVLNGDYDGKVRYSRQSFNSGGGLAIPNTLTVLVNPTFDIVTELDTDIVKISVNLTFFHSQGNQMRQYDFGIWREGTDPVLTDALIYSQSSSLDAETTGNNYQTMSFNFTDKPPAVGDYTYTFKHEGSATGFALNGSKCNIHLECINRVNHVHATEDWEP